jgi:hypothetical protein
LSPIAAALFAAGPVQAQTPAPSIAPENLVAAREPMRVEKQYNAMMPTLQ